MKAIALLALTVSLEAGFLLTLALPAADLAAAEARNTRAAVQARVVHAPEIDRVRS